MFSHAGSLKESLKRASRRLRQRIRSGVRAIWSESHERMVVFLPSEPTIGDFWLVLSGNVRLATWIQKTRSMTRIGRARNWPKKLYISAPAAQRASKSRSNGPQVPSGMPDSLLVKSVHSLTVKSTRRCLSKANFLCFSTVWQRGQRQVNSEASFRPKFEQFRRL